MPCRFHKQMVQRLINPWPCAWSEISITPQYLATYSTMSDCHTVPQNDCPCLPMTFELFLGLSICLSRIVTPSSQDGAATGDCWYMYTMRPPSPANLWPISDCSWHMYLYALKTHTPICQAISCFRKYLLLFLFTCGISPVCEAIANTIKLIL